MGKLDIQVTKRLAQILENPTILKPKIQQTLDKAALIVLRKYKQEAPVDKGGLRQGVTILGSGLEKRVTTTATGSGGFPYPVVVHEGKGRFKGGSDDPSTGRSRKGDASLLGMFMGMAKRGFKFSSRPNRFAKRAAETSRPEVIKFFNEEIKSLLE